MRLTGLLLTCLLVLPSVTGAATTDQLRQWILTNRKSLPGAEALTQATENDLASTILRIFGFGGEKKAEPTTTTTAEPSTTAGSTRSAPKVTEREVCPFGADPLILSGEYAFCKPSSVGDCPVGFLCDQSFVLGRSICCQDLRNRRVSPNRHDKTSVRPPFNWNTVTPTQSKWSPFTTPQTTRRAPWYIKDRTPWNNAYNRVTPESRSATSTELTSTTSESTTTSTSTTTTTTQAPTTTVTTKISNPWARLWTTTTIPRNSVNVSVLQSGSIRPLKDNQFETVGAITLVNDNGFLVLVDTGASSDTERLLQRAGRLTEEAMAGREERLALQVSPEGLASCLFCHVRLRTAAFLVALVDSLALGTGLFRLAEVYLTAVATGSLLARYLFFVLVFAFSFNVASLVLLLAGLASSRSGLLLPRVFFQGFGILCSTFVVLFGLVYFLGASVFLDDFFIRLRKELLPSQVLDEDSEAFLIRFRSTLIGLLFYSLVAILVQSYFFSIIRASQKYLRGKELWRRPSSSHFAPTSL